MFVVEAVVIVEAKLSSEQWQVLLAHDDAAALASLLHDSLLSVQVAGIL